MIHFLRLRWRFLSALIIIQSFLLPYSADAYIDPNTGGFFFSSVLPFVYGILAVLVMFWKRIVNAVKGFFSRKKDDDDK
ncbi:MAG: hypothetical protein HY808_01185 [Nitrospirae bacterium]|nr:hypothetical protein [Nitrospirota bacterium]